MTPPSPAPEASGPSGSPAPATPATEVWQRGPVAGFAPALQPAVHALLQVIEEAEANAAPLSHRELWLRPYDIASVGFHLLHTAGATDRLLTYARDERLSPDQLDYVRAEGTPLGTDVSAAALVERMQQSLHASLERIRAIDPARFNDARYIG